MATKIASTAVVHPGVELGDNSVVEDYCIVGAAVKGQDNLKTVIGPGAYIRSHTVIYAGNKIGKNFQTGNKANIRELNEIGDNVSVGTLSVVEHHVKIEDGVRIHSQAFVPEYTHLMEGAWLGPQVVLTNAKVPLAPDAKSKLKGPTIEKRARVGANSTILPGVRLGEDCLVGAGSVVTKDVKSQTVVAGNPAREIGKK